MSSSTSTAPRSRLGGGWIAAIAVAVAVVGVNVFAAWGAVVPLYWQDEAGYLANSQVLSGVGEPLEVAGRPYYIGWSALLAPLWWFLADGQQVYIGAIVLSALCSIATTIPLALIARRCGLRTPWAIVAAGVVSLAPGRALYSNLVIAENFLALVVALAVLFAFRYLSRPSLLNAGLLAAFSSLAFITHGRALPLVVATVAWLLFRARRAPLASVLGVGISALVSGGGFLLYRIVAEKLYRDSASREASGISRLFDPDVWPVILSGIGQLWYVVFAWLGLTVVGAILVIRRLRSELVRRRPSLASWYTLAILGVCLISFTYIANAIGRGAGRIDIYSYGRYLDPFVVPLALVGVVAVFRVVSRRTAVIATIVTAAVAVVWFVVVYPAIPTTGGQNWFPINILGTVHLPWRGMTWLPASPWLYLTAIVLAALIVAIVFWGRRVVLAVALLLYFTLASVGGELRMMRPYFVAWNASYTLRHVIHDDPLLNNQPVAFDIAGLKDHGDGASKNAYQVLLAPDRVDVFDSRESDPPDVLVIAREDWERADELGALKIADDEGVFSNALWVLPGELQDELLAADRVQGAPRG